MAQVRGIARHLRESPTPPDAWDPRFRDGFVPLLVLVGRRVSVPSTGVSGLAGAIDAVIDELATAPRPDRSWTLYGSLLANTRSVVDVVDDVARARQRGS